jgi:hypothetical protein
MASARSQTVWKDDRLYLGARLSGYEIVQDKRYPTMWRVSQPDGSLSDMVNRTRAKDAALDMLDRDLKAALSHSRYAVVR